jgi:Flp pilus assembly pilin Flp
MKLRETLKRSLDLIHRIGLRLLVDRSGAAMSEYVVLVGVVGLVVVTALVGIGPQLLSSYERSRGIVMCPLP